MAKANVTLAVQVCLVLELRYTEQAKQKALVARSHLAPQRQCIHRPETVDVAEPHGPVAVKVCPVQESRPQHSKLKTLVACLALAASWLEQLHYVAG